MVSRIKGYDCIITTTTKASKEKLEQLRALGAKVIVCPGKVSSTDPQSYYSVAAQLEKEIPNSIWINQYDNGANPDAHYKTTGPEIWKQTKGKLTHFVAAVGSGGTISGTGRFLKEQNPNLKVIGVDAYGSVLKKYHESGVLDENEKHSYQIEGVGKKIIPGNIAFDIIDKFIKVDDKNSALRARELFKTEALFGGYSTGAVVQSIFKMRNEFKKGDFVVVLLPDHGSKYMSKIYSDQWMEEQGYFEETKLIPSLSSYYNNTYKKYYYQRIAKIKELRQPHMDLFEKIKNNRGPLGQYAKIAEGYWVFPKLTGEIGGRMDFQGKEVICWSVNNYLGMANHPEVRKVDAEASKDWGLAYPMGARLMTGETDQHQKLEKDLANFVGKPAGALLNFGYQGIMSCIDSLLSRRDIVVYDAESHGCNHRWCPTAYGSADCIRAQQHGVH